MSKDTVASVLPCSHLLLRGQYRHCDNPDDCRANAPVSRLTDRGLEPRSAPEKPGNAKASGEAGSTLQGQVEQQAENLAGPKSKKGKLSLSLVLHVSYFFY